MLSVIIPTLNAEARLPAFLEQLQKHVDEVIISDGGSTDATLGVALDAGAKLAIGCKGRGWQLARGAKFSSGEWMLFLHADSRLDTDWKTEIDHHIKHFPDRAGYFRLKFQADGLRPRCLELWVRLRGFLASLPYGDQGLLIHRDVYEQIGGYPDWPLFEDVHIVRALGGQRLRFLNADIYTSAERYEQQGYLRRGVGNLWLLLRYYLGADPYTLARRYDK